MLLAFFRNLFRKRRMDQDLDDELRSYLELTTVENIRRGMAPEAAAAEARRDLGGMEQVKENVRDVRAGVSLDIFLQDVRYALRGVRKNPAFAATATLTLALGIGANTTVFSIVNGVLLKPLPYPSPERLVTLWESHPKFGRFLTVAPANFYDWRAQSSSLDHMTALDPYPDFILTGGSQPHRLTGAAVTADFFPLFGIRMTLGRGFQAAEDHAAVLSYATWQQYFGGRTDIAGRVVRLNDESYTVVGVLPRDFYLVAKASDFQSRKHFDVLINLGLTVPPEEWQRETHPLFAFGRLKPGVRLEQAQADLAHIALNLARMYPSADQDHTIDVVPMADNAVGGVRTALLTLLASVGIVLLIACANIANLLLARAAARQKEMALRAALGASRKRLARQLLTESGVLAAIGSAIGLALALWAVPSVAAHLPADLPRTSEIAVDRRVLALTSLIAVATGILFGLVPLASSRGVGLHSRGVTSGHSRLRSALIVGQVSLAVVLLAGAGLMTKSLRALLKVSPGFRTDHILTAQVSLPPRYANAWKFGIGLRRGLSAFQRELADRVRAIPGVRSAAFVSYLPLTGTDNNWAFFIEGRPPKPPGEFDSADYRPVTAGYFETMGIPVIRGRSFTPQDDESHPLAVVISESMARRFWPGEDALGKRLKFGGDDWRTIVGIAGDVHHQALSSLPQPEMYVPWGQVPNVEIRPTMVVRSFVDPASLTSALRTAVAAVDPEVPMDHAATMDQLVSDSAAESRFRAVFLSAFALLALFVASIGLYGVMSYLVNQRTREFGIRMAMGATRGSVLALVLRQGAKLAGIGVVIGLAAAAALGPLIAGLLYGVKPLDAVTFAGVSILPAAAALLASYIPARRAANADPMQSLRYE